MLRAAYPAERIAWRRIWGAYVAAYGFNQTVPARGGNLVRLFLTKSSVPNSSYPAVASSFLVDNVFDLIIAVPVLAFAFTQGVFPKPPDFSKLNAFDLSYFASHPKFALFVITALGIAVRTMPPIASAVITNSANFGCDAKYERSNAFSFEKSGGFGKTPCVNANVSTTTAIERSKPVSTTNAAAIAE